MTSLHILGRPTTVEGFQALAKLMWDEETKEKWKTFKPQSGDVFVTPYGKSGTTWLQQIVHGLRTRGDMDFDDISRVVPWLEVSYGLGLDLNAPQKALPRAFKSHLSWHDIPKGARYIVSVRDPKDALVSLYRFMEGWWFEPNSISLETFASEVYLADRETRGYWHHLASWWPQRNDEAVLMMSYEHMKEDLRATVHKVARFIGIDLDEELLEIVLRQSSLEFMSAHKDKFDDRLMREHSEKVAGLPAGSDSAKVRTGRIGDHHIELTANISAELDQIWRDEIESTLGIPSYQALNERLADR